MAVRKKTQPATQPAKELSPEDQAHVGRWRLVLGKVAEQQGLTAQDEQSRNAQSTIDFVFDDGQKGAGSEGSQLTVPKWIDAVERALPPPGQGGDGARADPPSRACAQLLDHPKLLEKIEPNVELVKTLLTHKDLLDPQTRESWRARSSTRWCRS